MSKSLVKVINLILSTVLIINLIPNVLVLADEETDKEMVRVGYTENYGVVKSPMVSGFEGYGYEYLRKIEEYTNYEFEFVLCDWSETTNMLRNGELDIIAPASITDERVEEFYFTKNLFAKQQILLVSNDEIFLDEKSYNYLNLSKIGVRKNGVFNVYLEEFIKENNLTPEIEFVDISNYTEELKKGEFKYLLTGSLQMERNLNVALSLNALDSYFMGTSKELIDNLDVAMEKIASHEYLFKEELYTKYSNHSAGNNKFISSQELRLIQDSPYDVGVINMYPTLGYSNTKNINNVSVDVLNYISSILKIDINFIEISSESTKEELDKLDFYIYLNGYDTDLYQNKSIPYMKDDLLIIENTKNFYNTSVGVLDYYNLQNDMVSNLTLIDDITYYSSVRELIDGFKSGEVSSIMLVSSVYELLYGLFKDVNHQTKNLYYPISPSIIYTDNFPVEKIQIIDKALSYLTDEHINTMLLHNMSLINDKELKLMYQRYLMTFLPIIILGVIIYIILKKAKQKEVEKISNYDQLTNLYTQQKFIKETKKLLNKNSNMNFTMLLFDIDNFKYINELYGFEVGDNILNVIGNFLKDNVSNEYPISRLSSDHFILITQTNNELRNGKLSEKNCDILSKRISYIVGSKFDVEYSIGLYIIEDNKVDISKMIDYCNLARSFSKKELGNVATVYSDSMNEKEKIKNDIVHKMSSSLKNKEFVLYYQPKFDIITQKIVGAEALVRWFSNGKMMPPNDFIPLFEKNGFIEKLDYYVIDTTCNFISTHKDISIPLISVNLSSVTIMKSDVVERIVEILDKYSIKPEQVELEITESAFVDQFEVALERIDSLRASGFTISMDDFGTGVSSLGRLKNMDIDVLKIDREFIIETLQNSKSDVILENIINMANQLDLETIAEGIETEEQLGFLRQTGCNIGQGYYFARPLPEKDFLKLLKDNS